MRDAQHLYDIAQQIKSVVGPRWWVTIVSIWLCYWSKNYHCFDYGYKCWLWLIKKSSLWVTLQNLQIISGTPAVSNILQRETWLERSRMFQDRLFHLWIEKNPQFQHVSTANPNLHRQLHVFPLGSKFVQPQVCANWVTRLRNFVWETQSSIW